MTTLTKDQIRHEIINLRKTVKHLERTVDDEEWTTSSESDRLPKWLKTQTVLKGVKHCRSALKAIPPEVYNRGLGEQQAMSGEQFHDDIVQILNRLELSMKDASLEFIPGGKKPAPRLHTIPLPKSLSGVQKRDTAEAPAVDARKESPNPSEFESEQELERPPSPKDLFDTIPDTIPSSADKASALLPPSFPSLSSPPPTQPHIPNSTSASAFLSTSSALQDDLAQQLAQMAQQLKQNSIQFSSTLSRDAGVMKEVEEKLERNADVLGKERVRLRDHRGKSGNTTWIVMLSIVVVFIGFFVSFFVIRIT